MGKPVACPLHEGCTLPCPLEAKVVAWVEQRAAEWRASSKGVEYRRQLTKARNGKKGRGAHPWR